MCNFEMQVWDNVAVWKQESANACVFTVNRRLILSIAFLHIFLRVQLHWRKQGMIAFSQYNADADVLWAHTITDSSHLNSWVTWQMWDNVQLKVGSVRIPVFSQSGGRRKLLTLWHVWHMGGHWRKWKELPDAEPMEKAIISSLFALLYAIARVRKFWRCDRLFDSLEVKSFASCKCKLIGPLWNAHSASSGSKFGLLSMIVSTKVQREKTSALWWGELLGAKDAWTGISRVRGLWCLCILAGGTFVACISYAVSAAGESNEAFRWWDHCNFDMPVVCAGQSFVGIWVIFLILFVLAWVAVTIATKTKGCGRWGRVDPPMSQLFGSTSAEG